MSDPNAVFLSTICTLMCITSVLTAVSKAYAGGTVLYLGPSGHVVGVPELGSLARPRLNNDLETLLNQLRCRLRGQGHAALQA
jgi:hypothetical protein